MKIKSGAGFPIIKCRRLICESGHFKSSGVKLTDGASFCVIPRQLNHSRQKPTACRLDF